MLSDILLEEHVRNALKEDIGYSDLTTDLIFSEENKTVTAYMNSREEGILCGTQAVKKVFELLSDEAEVKFFKKDGDVLKKGDTIAEITAPERALLSGERVSLNYVRQMSGIATETAKYIKQMNNPNVILADTRKTTPGFRMFEKYSVATGGGHPHRFNLSDCVMIKDNHIECAGSITNAVNKVKEKLSHAYKIEVECETEEQVKEALNVGVDIIMLDNMDIPNMEKCIKLINHRAIVEISGNVKLNTVGEIAKVNPDVISTSAIHSGVKPLDIGLDM